MKSLFFLWFSILVICSCGNGGKQKKDSSSNVVDKLATDETRALSENLRQLGPGKIIIGQQDATAYGVDWRNEDLRSDINEVSGRFPALYGWNLGYLENSENIDSVNYDRMKLWIKSAFERGGINMISLFFRNPLTSGACTDTLSAVAFVLPGGSGHHNFKSQLKSVAIFINDLKTRKGTLVPVLLRLFPKNNVNKYWWGNHSCNDQEFKSLYQFAVSYLKDSCHVHNALYVYSTDIFADIDEYTARYPGNEYVDIVGFDNYIFYNPPYKIEESLGLLRQIVRFAEENNKIPSLTETGMSGLENPRWFTQKLLQPIKNDSIAGRIAFLMLGPNADRFTNCAPYNGHASVKDFIQFENDPLTIFEEDLPPMYQSAN